MFKRANKITALLVAAAAVVSLVPATGVNAADVKRIESEDGTVYGAVAYKDGKFIIDGEIEDKDEAVYFVNGGKYTELEDVDTGSTYGIYGEKYATVDTDDYYVDLTSGKVTDDEIAQDEKDDAETSLRKKIKKDNDDRVTNEDAYVRLNEITAGSKFKETWYESTQTYTTSAEAQVKEDYLHIYTDANGAYIDGDYNVGKIKIKTDAGNVTLENTLDAEKIDDDNTARVGVSNVKVIGQDKNYIYRLVDVTITVTGGAEITHLNNKALATSTDKYTYTAIQKISKAQASDDAEGLKYAKTVTTYAVSDEDGTSFDAVTVAKPETELELINRTSNFTVVNGKIIAYKEIAGEVVTRTITLKTKSGYDYTDVSDRTAEDVTQNEDGNGYAYALDVDGNLWRLESGNIYKFDNDEDWDKVYKVDGSMTDFTIYDKDNFVVWNEEDEVYSIVGGKTSAEVETPEVTVGWVQNADSTWSYNKEDGTKATGWLNLNGTWYYLKADGVMATGWIQDGATWYYTNASGAMQTGWILDGGTWYYTNASGAMQTGWINDNGTWYYTNASGAMLANTTVNGYVLGANGAWIR